MPSKAGAAHALHHALGDLTQPQEKDKQAPHSDGCQKCADYAQLGSALNVGAYDHAPLLVFSEAYNTAPLAFRSLHTLPAIARGPPQYRRVTNVCPADSGAQAIILRVIVRRTISLLTRLEIHHV
ncbi:MAG: hypothetical protein WDM70_09055 [Nitrosomonadales bacterium]